MVGATGCAPKIAASGAGQCGIGARCRSPVGAAGKPWNRHILGLGTGLIECGQANNRNSQTRPPVFSGMESRIMGVALLAARSFSTLPAWPHAFLEQASPEVGSTVQGSPEAINLRFSEDLEPAFSMVSVLDQAGNRVNTGNVGVDTADPKLLRVPLRPLAPGLYEVGWRVVSVDTHATQGNFTFQVTAR